MKDILIAALPYLIPIALAGLGWLTKKLSDLISAHVSNKALAGVLTRADYSVSHAVQFVAQTFVDDLKDKTASGALPDAAAADAKAKAIEAAKSFLGTKGIQELMGVIGIKDLGGLDQWLGMRIESAVKSLSNVTMQPATPIPNTLPQPAAAPLPAKG